MVHRRVGLTAVESRPTMTEVLTDWDGSTQSATELQRSLAERVCLTDDFSPPSFIAGFDVGFEDSGATTRAAAVLLDAHTLDVIAREVVRTPTSMPYIPGLLSFRELPALVRALDQLPRRPDLAFVDGHGLAHPRRLGVASHFGVATNLPTVGVAKSVLVGKFDPPGPAVGDTSPLVHRGDTVALMLRTKLRCRPLIISTGHRVSLRTAVEFVLRYGRGYRLPEPTRLADRLASRRDTPHSPGA